MQPLNRLLALEQKSAKTAKVTLAQLGGANETRVCEVC